MKSELKQTFPICLRTLVHRISFCLVLCIAIVDFGDHAIFAGDLNYFLPAGTTHSTDVTPPADFYNFEVGSWHIQHHELVAYSRQLAKQSPRVRLTEYARSHGQRPLMMLTITSEKNHERLESIRAEHLLLADPDQATKVDTQQLPAVVWMGYGVHGNEPSASNAASVVAYHLAAGRGAAMDKLLDETVILLDPCLNPDGFDRFAQWANAHRGRVPNSDPQHREHREGSPTGRTNYYWFDLNRDWLPLQHPESRGRLEIYHQWLPNVVLDYHEMGSDATYFFQPGVPSRMHPLTPQRNLDFTRQFAQAHSKELNKLGSLYFTEERFDDFYMGKGSTYPDLHGAVGILFEQASARGIEQETANGRLTFSFAIRNQVRTSLTSLAATVASRVELHEYKRQFYADSLALARNAKTRAFVFTAGRDKARADKFIELMKRHGIEVYALARDVEVSGKRFSKQQSFVIPAEQNEYRFLLAVTEARKEFADKVFYDISAWTVPMAFGLTWGEVESALDATLLGPLVDKPTAKGTVPQWSDDDYAYIVEWHELHAPRTLARLLAGGVKVKVAQRPFTVTTESGVASFEPGSLLIPLGIQQVAKSKVHELLEQSATEDYVQVHTAQTGLTGQGVDLGSSSFAVVPRPKVMLVVGVGTDDSEAGEVWHLLDKRLGMPITLVDGYQLAGTKLDEYTTIVLVSGTYNQVSPAAVEKLQTWLKRGGSLLSIGTAARWLNTEKITSLKMRVAESAEAAGEKSKEAIRRLYSEADDRSALERVEGTIFQTQIDRTHPIGFGFQSEFLPVFRDQALFLDPSTNPYSTPVVYTESPLLSGYASANNQKLAAGSAAVVVKAEGLGRVIAIPNNPNFRAFWFGSERLFTNSLFFGPIVREP